MANPRKEGGEDMKVTVSQGERGCGKEEWGGGERPGAETVLKPARAEEDAQGKTERLQGVCRHWGLRQEMSHFVSRQRKTADALA